ncbi:hypothetical protein D3C80_1606550 [compost metagenome]
MPAQDRPRHHAGLLGVGDQQVVAPGEQVRPHRQLPSSGLQVELVVCSVQPCQRIHRLTRQRRLQAAVGQQLRKIRQAVVPQHR